MLIYASGSVVLLVVVWFVYRRHRRKVLLAKILKNGSRPLGMSLDRILNPMNRDLMPKENHDRS